MYIYKDKTQDVTKISLSLAILKLLPLNLIKKGSYNINLRSQIFLHYLLLAAKKEKIIYKNC